MSRQALVPAQFEEATKMHGFAPGVVAGDWIFVSGQVGRAPGGALADGAEGQARQALKNVATILESAGASLDDVVELTSFHVGLKEQFAGFSAVKGELFSDPRTVSWTALGVSELAAPGLLVEVKATAYLAKD